MAEPEDNDFEERFQAMMSFEDFDLNVSEVEGTVTDVTTLNDLEVMDRFNAVKKELRDRKETLEPRTDEGHALSSEYHALLLEMKNRKLL